ncbi:aldo/keto reductase [bacterium]|nr:MAG: aldo/keto reductase [bacterium]
MGRHQAWRRGCRRCSKPLSPPRRSARKTGFCGRNSEVRPRSPETFPGRGPNKLCVTRRKFGKTGLEVSPLGFGGAPIGLLDTEQDTAERIVRTLIDRGVNLFDTAESYAGSEEMLGRALEGRRDEVVLVSKCGWDIPELPGEAWSPELIAATVDRSLARLNTDRLDAMLLHSCEQEVLERGEAMAALVKAKEAGKVRFVGYSGDNAKGLYGAELDDVEVFETSVSFLDQANLEAVIPAAQARGLGTIAKRPLANGAWKPRKAQEGFFKDYADAYHKRFEAMGLALEDFDVEDWAELALRFTLSAPGVHTAITGMTSPEEAEANLVAAEKGPLPPKAMERLRAAFDREQKRSEDGWPGLE